MNQKLETGGINFVQFSFKNMNRYENGGNYYDAQCQNFSRQNKGENNQMKRNWLVLKTTKL